MITIANCLTLDQALALQSLLDANGIPSFIPDEATAAVAQHHFFTQHGVRLQVAPENEQAAREIISGQANEES